MIPRLLLFAALTALLVAAGVWLADHPGQVSIHWLGWRVESSVAVLITLLAALWLLVLTVWRVGAAIWAAPGAVWRKWQNWQHNRAYRALADGLGAVALGEGRTARRLARRVEHLLPDPRLGALLAAQAAQLTGNLAEQEQALQRLANHPDSAAIGLKGLVELALQQDQRDKALACARRAWDLPHCPPGLAEILADLLMEQADWTAADTVLRQAEQRRSLPRDLLLPRQARVWTHLAEQAGEQGQGETAFDLLRRACRADPSCAPAACLLARHLHRLNKPRKAQAVLIEAWRHRPDPSLLSAWYALAPAETPLQRVERLSRLVRSNPNAVDSHRALGEAALQAQLWGQARTHLLKAAEHGTDPVLLAALAQVEGR